MKRLFFLIILTWLIVLNVHGQDVNKSNYKAYAHCEEVQGPDGKIYNTFGEGYCPPGTKRDTRDYSQKKLDSINNAFDSVRDAMLAKHKKGLIKDYKDNFEFIRDTKMIFLAGGSTSTFNVISVVNASVPSLPQSNFPRFIVGSVPENKSDFNSISTA